MIGFSDVWWNGEFKLKSEPALNSRKPVPVGEKEKEEKNIQKPQVIRSSNSQLHQHHGKSIGVKRHWPLISSQ